MFVCCECCVLSGRGLCHELITCPEESYRLWCVVVCDLENLVNEAMTRVGSQRHKKNQLLCKSDKLLQNSNIWKRQCKLQNDRNVRFIRSHVVKWIQCPIHISLSVLKLILTSGKHT